MSIKAINTAELNTPGIYKNKDLKQNTQSGASQPSFQGLEAVPIALADTLYRGGYITSFMLQDFVGMACPRMLEGMNRRQINPETGKKEGPYNWKFARREGIREVLSGPSAYLIPWLCLKVIKKYSGSANNVPINLIQGYGNNFIHYAAQNESTLSNVVKTRKDFYIDIYKNVLNTSLNGQLNAKELAEKAEEFASRTIEIEQAKDKSKSFIKVLINKRVEGSPEDLRDDLIDDFMKLKKRYLNSSTKEMNAEMVINPEKLGVNPKELTAADKTGVGIKKLIKSLTDFSDDVIDSTGKALEKYKNQEFNVKNFLNDFVLKRTGSRILTNVGMWSAVVAFYMIIPTLYSWGLGGKNPSFAMEENKEKAANSAAVEADDKKSDKPQKDTTFEGKNIAFTGKESLFKQTAEKVLRSDKLKSFLNHFEFDDAAMTVSSMMALLYGFCLPTRMIKASDKYDFNETIHRDFLSFGAILFAAEALSRGFSVLSTKISGLALNVMPANHNKNIFTTVKDYFWPIGGIDVLKNKELQSKYTNVHEFKDGINGLFDYVSSNRGNLKKFLQLDETVAKNAKIILGKDIKDVANDNEIKEAFRNITTDAGKKAKEVIENVFKDSNNKYVRRAKLYNSMFTFLSTVALVPIFMIWLARSCEKMTRKAKARDMELQTQKENASMEHFKNQEITQSNIVHPAAKVTMQGFMAK